MPVVEVHTGTNGQVLFPACRKPFLAVRLRRGVNVTFKVGLRELGLPTPRFRPCPRLRISRNVVSSSRSSYSTGITSVLPFVAPMAVKIIQAWCCTILSVTCLSLFVRRIGTLTSSMVAGDLSSLFRQASLVISLVALRSAAQFLQDAWLWEVATEVTLSLRRHVYHRVQNLDTFFFEGREEKSRAGVSHGNSTEDITSLNCGDMAFRISQETESSGDAVFAALHGLVPSLLQLVAMVWRMVSLSLTLTVATVCVLPCMAAVISVLGEKVRRVSKKGQESMAALTAYVNEMLPAMTVVKMHSAEEYEMQRFFQLAQVDCKARLQKKRLKCLFPHAITAAYSLAVLSLFVSATWLISQSSLSPASLVSFLSSLVLLVEPIQEVGTAVNEIKQSQAAMERVLSLAAIEPELKDRSSGAVTLQGVRGDIEFKNVSFRYSQSEDWVLQDINLKVAAGETVAIVGPSGGGKSTIFKLLMRLYDPARGCVLVDGVDIRSATLSSLRTSIGIMPQDTVLFSGTVAQNIAYGVMAADLDMRLVTEAATLANAVEFIERLPAGYDTVLGERGMSLSGGERQRLGIARALYHRPGILLLDEATSALDNSSEKFVREALEMATKQRTVIIIAHRLESVTMADRIYFICNGRIIEQGTHHSLINNYGPYASLFGAQKGSGC